jgi:hypothetical protein
VLNFTAPDGRAGRPDVSCTGLATAEVLANVQFEAGPGRAGHWEGIFPGKVPVGADGVMPQLLTADTIDLECNELQVIQIGRAAETVRVRVAHSGNRAYNFLYVTRKVLHANHDLLRVPGEVRRDPQRSRR